MKYKRYPFSMKTARMIFDKTCGQCAYCGQDLEFLYEGEDEYDGQMRRGFEIDHVVPISKGGSNTYENLVASCYTCNRTKSDKFLDDFRELTGNHFYFEEVLSGVCYGNQN